MPDTSTSEELFTAIKAGDLSRVKRLVSAQPGLVDARSAGGESAILTAVYSRRRDIANLLVARGAALTLSEAAAAGELERVERLLGSEQVNGFSPDGWTPLHLAAFFGHQRVAELLLAHGADTAARSRNANANTPLHAALAANQTMIAGLLIGRGADVNAEAAGGWRPIHSAAAADNLEALRTLIAQGAEVHSATAEGVTALGLAEQKGHREAAALLRRHGAR